MQAKSLTVLGKREVELVERETGVDLSGLFVLRDWAGGIWMASRELSKLDFSRLSVSSIGLRFAETKRDGSIRLLK